MWYPAKVVTPPPAEPVSLAQAKVQCGVASGDSSKDDVLSRLISASRSFVEKYCGIFAPKQSIEVKCDHFSDFARLPCVPLRSVTAVTYLDVAGDQQLALSSIYEVRSDGLEAEIVLKSGQTWPRIHARSRIAVAADVGFDPVPPELTSAMLLWIGSINSLGRTDAALKSRSVVGVGAREWDTSGAVDATVRASIGALLENYRCWAAL